MDWMKYIKNPNEKKITDLVLPASHNSGAYLFNFEIPFIGFSTCQSMTIKTQLENGIRFFDFRISKKNKDIHLSHYLQFGKLKNILNDIINFLNINKTEIVVLSIVWDYSKKDDMDWDLFNVIIDNKNIQNLLMEDNDLMKNINYLRKMNKRLFIMTPNGLNKNLEYKWNNVWDQNKGINMVKDYLLKDKDDRKQFYWLKCEVTCKIEYIKHIIFNNFRFGLKRYAKEYNLKVLNLLTSIPSTKWKVNIISTDFVDKKIIKLIINHNLNIK